MRTYSFLPAPTSDVFPCIVLADQIMIAIESGVSQSVPTTLAYDDDFSFDPMANIHTERLDMYEYNICNLGTSDAKPQPIAPVDSPSVDAPSPSTSE